MRAPSLRHSPTLMTCDRLPFEANSMMMFSLLSLSEVR